MHEPRQTGSESRSPEMSELAERLEEIREAVRDVEGPEPGPLTSEDVETLRDADLGELAEIAERYVA